jgi:DNA primase
MARYRDDSKERVRDAVDFADLVSKRTELRRAGPNRLQGLCPFHEERTPSFGIDPVNKLYYCFGCQAKGDLFTFVQETEGLDFIGALEFLADRYGVQLELEEEDPRAAERRAKRDRLLALLERAAAFYATSLWESDEAAAAREYLAGRGLSDDTLRAFRVGYAPSGWDRLLLGARRAGFSEAELHATGLAVKNKEGRVYDRFRRRIMFPLTDLRGRVLGFGARALSDDQQPKYLNSPEGELYHKGRQLFAVDRARAAAAKSGSVLLVEGYMDVLALHQAGIENAVGLMGTAMTEDQAGELARLAPVVQLALDADAAGRQAMLKAATVAEGKGVELRVVPLRAGDDPADIVTRDGAEAMHALVEASAPFVRFHVESVLAAADLGSADGRDRALAELRGVLGGVPPSVMRDELVRLVAGRLGLGEELVASLASAPAARAAGGGSAAAGGNGGAAAVLDRRERTERTFLALCIASPEAGAQALARLDLDRHLSSPLTRRAAAHLRDHVAAPLEGLAADDVELADLVSSLVVRAGAERGDPRLVEIERTQLELSAIEREIAAARAEGRLEVSALAAERVRLRAELDDLVEAVAESS